MIGNGKDVTVGLQIRETRGRWITNPAEQGSLILVVNASPLGGSSCEYLSYDAWGRRRKPNYPTIYSGITSRYDRGYTMHEHYDGFTLINMNGRLYAPVIGRMLQPDIVIQDQYNSQAYNSYSYCLNNPLRYVDPSGYVVTPFSNFKWNYNILDFSVIEKINNGSFNTENAEGKKAPNYDWFENEETGAIYYNSSLHKGDLVGNGWKWLGENGMFSNGFVGYDFYLVSNYGGVLDFKKDGYVTAKLYLNPHKAKDLMARVGYKLVNTQVIVYSDTYDQSVSDGRHNFRFTYGTSISYSEKTGYVPNGFEEIDRTQLGITLYGDYNHATYSFPEVSRYHITYGSPSSWGWIGKILQIMKIGNGYHDYVNYYDGGSIDSYYKSGAHNSLINEFLKRYPK